MDNYEIIVRWWTSEASRRGTFSPRQLRTRNFLSCSSIERDGCYCGIKNADTNKINLLGSREKEHRHSACGESSEASVARDN